MIYLYKKTPLSQVATMIAKEFPTHEIARFHDVSDTADIMQSLQGRSLFDQPQVVFLSQIDRSLWDQIGNTFTTLPETTKIFWVEDSFPPTFLKKLPPHTISEYTSIEKGDQKTNPFNLANHIATGNGVNAWTTYRQLIEEGNEPEMLFGIVWWKIKDIAKKKSVLSKNFKKTITGMLSLYSSARSGNSDLEHDFELFLLNFSSELLK